MSDTTNATTDTLNNVGVPPTPPEAHQRADEGGGSDSGYSATYSPEDNKLRLTAPGRLDAALYARVKDAGFSWAPKQGVFVAARWTPGREDLLVELCGEVGDEDSTMQERAEVRAERFAGYQVRRSADAAAAHSAVSQIAGRFEFGQPILIGHHSERRARKDKERMDDGMRRAVRMWDTAEYWKDRAANSLAHAQFKERPDVRARRIKGLEADQRKQQKHVDECERRLAFWSQSDISHAQALEYANHSHYSRCFPLADFPRDPPASQYEGPMGLWSALDGGVIDVARAQSLVVPSLQRSIAHASRWLAHYANRIGYEGAMLAESGGLPADKFDIVPGGSVLVRGEWMTVVRVNKRAGKAVSVTTNCRFVSVRGMEEINDYRAPTVEVAAAVKKATTLAKLCNYPGPDFLHMTQAEWKAMHADSKGSRQLGQGAVRARSGSGRPDITAAAAAAETVGLHRVRVVARGGLRPVFLTDAKTVPAPAPVAELPQVVALPAPVRAEPVREVHPVAEVETPADIDAMRAMLRAGGVQVVSAPQLFPTPHDLALRMVDEAQPAMGMRVLEPSAGTGALLCALPGGGSFGNDRQTWAKVTAVEINGALAESLRNAGLASQVVHADFLSCTPEELGQFDAVLMNPPFADAADIKHIQHARRFLRAGGCLVAICANGPRQQAALQPIADETGGFYEPLPAGSFASTGTNVNTALLVIRG